MSCTSRCVPYLAISIQPSFCLSAVDLPESPATESSFLKITIGSASSTVIHGVCRSAGICSLVDWGALPRNVYDPSLQSSNKFSLVAGKGPQCQEPQSSLWRSGNETSRALGRSRSLGTVHDRLWHCRILSLSTSQNSVFVFFLKATSTNE